jgi:cytochrome c553
MNTSSIQTLARCFAWAVACGFAATAHAQLTAETLHTRATAAMCANCHGTEGRTIEGSSVPSLASMPKDYMVLQMKAFKEGTRPDAPAEQRLDRCANSNHRQLLRCHSTLIEEIT